MIPSRDTFKTFIIHYKMSLYYTLYIKNMIYKKKILKNVVDDLHNVLKTI